MSFTGVLSLPSDQARDRSGFYAIIFIVVGILAGLAMFLESFMFALSGESDYNACSMPPLILKTKKL